MSLLRAILRVLIVVPLARLALRLMAWRLLWGPMASFQISRDERLAVAAKAGGRCAACGAKGPLEADHHRPFWAGGLDVAENIVPLCLACHDVKTKAEARVRALQRRVRHRSGHGGLRADVVPAHRLALVALVGVGMVDGTFDLLNPWVRVGAVVLLVVGLRWQWRRRLRLGDLADTIIEYSPERRTYAPSLRRDHLRVERRLRIEGARTRAVLIWLPSAYLLGFVLALALV